MDIDGLDFAHLDGAATLAIFPEIQAAYTQVFPGYDLGDHEWRTRRQAQSPGFETVTARRDGALIGFAYGLPLGPDTTWWKDLDTDHGPDFATETGSRTFALIDLGVLPPYRGQGLARRLVRDLLRGRPEQRATLATNPAKPHVQRMYERWGWSRVGSIPGGPGTTCEVFDLYTRELPEPEASSSR